MINCRTNHPLAQQDFNKYVSVKKNTASEQKKNNVMNNSFGFGKENNVDNYDTVLKILLPETGTDKFIF